MSSGKMNDTSFEEKIIGGRRCYIHEEHEPEFLIIQPVSENSLAGLESELGLIMDMLTGSSEGDLSPAGDTGHESYTGHESDSGKGKENATTGISIAAFVSEDWNAEMTPWEAPPVFGDEAFGCGAPGTLRYIEEMLLPELRNAAKPGNAPDLTSAPKLSADPEASAGSARAPKIIIGGYSLAGLFSLWAAYNSSSFDGAAAVSPSLWYPGWPEYAESHALRTGTVYLSLGDREEKTRNRTMARSGDNIRRQIELLKKDPACRACTLEWNPGNHFAEHNKRMAKGLVWLMRKLKD